MHRAADNIMYRNSVIADSVRYRYLCDPKPKLELHFLVKLGGCINSIK
jgi:hypothetical protein